MRVSNLQKVFYFVSACLVLSVLALSGCVQSASFKTVKHTLIKSNYPIVSINGGDVKETYQLDLIAGETTLIVAYSTYQYDYLCTFSWRAKAGTAYEITDQENQYPLTLYRWHRKNSMWAIRLDPVEPVMCDKNTRKKEQSGE